ncbi:MAG: peptidoglycan DD-metalloendopeptidase family protein [Acetivibrionales bacterium]|jgi:murein DD-endopeptidase MepM/ murein hydrolase activator NlpD
MKKGKVKKTGKKYTSIVMVPHSSSSVKVFRFRAFYAKLVVAAVILLSIFVSGGLYISGMLKENKALKQNLNELYSTNTEQRNLIEQKTDEINRLVEESASFRETVNDRIEEFTENFNKITDEYLAERSKLTSRSGERTETAFTNDMRNLKKSLDSLSSLYSRSGTIEADLDAAEAKIAEFMETVPTLWPAAGRLTAGFGYRKDPITRKTRFHEGIDIGSDGGRTIRASASGKVIFAKYTSGYGRTIKIDHGRGITTVYGHLSKYHVKVGQVVKKGDKIATMGTTGRSTGPHLHFEIRLFGTPVDPLKYLDLR